MKHNWEGTLKEHVTDCREKWLKEKLIHPGEVLADYPIDANIEAYYESLKKEIKSLECHGPLVADIEKVQRLIAIDARMNFLIGELVLVPKITFAEYIKEESQFSKNEYLSCRKTDCETIINFLREA